MNQLIIQGLASGKKLQTIDVPVKELEISLMDFLLKAGVPVASSCGGEGVCQKCKIMMDQKIILSCQIKMNDLFLESSSHTLTFSYL